MILDLFQNECLNLTKTTTFKMRAHIAHLINLDAFYLCCSRSIHK